MTDIIAESKDRFPKDAMSAANRPSPVKQPRSGIGWFTPFIRIIKKKSITAFESDPMRANGPYGKWPSFWNRTVCFRTIWI